MGKGFLLLVVLIAAGSQIASDMYLPSLPYITEALKTTKAATGLSITIFLLGQAIFQWVFGPLSEKIGRRKPILYGMGLCLIGTIICMVSYDIEILLIGRFLQGAGAAALMCVTLALIRDACEDNQFAKVMALVNMTFSIVFAAAPAIGGYLQEGWGWEASFEVSGLYLVALLIISYFFLPETHLPHKRDPQGASIKGIAKNAKVLLKSRIFMGYGLCVTLCYSVLVVYATTTPFLFQEVLHVTPVTYGWLAGVNAAALIFGSWLSSILLHKCTVNHLVVAGLIIMLIAGGIMLLLGLIGFVQVWAIMACMFFILVGVALIASAGSAATMSPFGYIAGTAGAMFMCLQMLGGFVTGTITAGFHTKTQVPLAVSIVLITIVSIFLYRMANKASGHANDVVI